MCSVERERETERKEAEEMIEFIGGHVSVGLSFVSNGSLFCGH